MHHFRRIRFPGTVGISYLVYRMSSVPSMSEKSAEDCDEVVCRKFKSLFAEAVKAQPKESIQSQRNTTLLPDEVKYIDTKEEYWKRCPPDRDQLGRSTWTLLHSVAANYPNTPSPTDMEKARQFVYTLAYFYPCKVCAEDFRENVARIPPQVDSRESFVLWCCNLHNKVNEKLGYPAFPCDFDALDERWRRGTPECSAASVGVVAEMEEEEEKDEEKDPEDVQTREEGRDDRRESGERGDGKEGEEKEVNGAKEEVVDSH